MQLTALGYILVPIFEYNQWWLVLLYALFMLAVAAAEAISRPAVAFDVSHTLRCNSAHIQHDHLCLFSTCHTAGDMSSCCCCSHICIPASA